MKLLKKTILIPLLLVVLGLAFYYMKNIYGWMEFQKNTDTPDHFLNRTVNNFTDYSLDSLTISSQLKKHILNPEHDEFLDSDEYFAGTEIIVDTIVYSSDLNKLAILILTKNPTVRQLMPIDGKSTTTMQLLIWASEARIH